MAKFIELKSKKRLATAARITLVGAGPGDPDLMTIKGLKALQSADVVLYDALVNEAILTEAPAHALKVFVGKRAGLHSYRQEEINLLLVQHALNYGHVVRLKGGDSFVFGRGHEELAYARAFDIPVNVVPGISSCIALPELQGIPPTRRALNESFWVLTGTTRSGALSQDVAIAAQSSATAIILMGMRKIREIMICFTQNDKQDTPVMVIQNGSLPNEKYYLGTVSTIADQLEANPTDGPGIIVVGEVVGLHEDLQEVVYGEEREKVRG
ncbi:MAG: uroporphyrinogen-III C-methyltransferase [Saprospiraceae bacterium]|nr:MAG: uroporphyrinogen-III C-methyltransferase [Saprospiraceae bacterium]